MGPLKANQIVPPTGGSRCGQSVIIRQWRLPSVADAPSSAAPGVPLRE
jgi:hypothetical protein